MQIAGGGLNQIYMIAVGEAARRKLIAANGSCSKLGLMVFQLLRLDDI